MPIPGSASVGHVEENCAAAELELDDADYDTIGRLIGTAG
jgi:diketogulonate reductase-like aldo/keto reductase